MDSILPRGGKKKWKEKGKKRKNKNAETWRSNELENERDIITMNNLERIPAISSFLASRWTSRLPCWLVVSHRFFMSSIFVKLIGRSRVARFAFTISLSTSVKMENRSTDEKIRNITFLFHFAGRENLYIFASTNISRIIVSSDHDFIFDLRIKNRKC